GSLWGGRCSSASCSTKARWCCLVSSSSCSSRRAWSTRAWVRAMVSRTASRVSLTLSRIARESDGCCGGTLSREAQTKHSQNVLTRLMYTQAVCLWHFGQWASLFSLTLDIDCPPLIQPYRAFPCMQSGGTTPPVLRRSSLPPALVAMARGYRLFEMGS